MRDLSRYRSRSGSALAAISLGVLIAVIICVLSASRYGNVLDYAGPNVASNQVLIYPPGQNCGPRCSAAPTSETPAQVRAEVSAIAASLGSHDVVTLDGADANLQHNGAGRQFTGQVYVATPQLLRAFGISPTSINSTAEVLSSRPGLAGYSNMVLTYGGGAKVGPSCGGRTIQPGGPPGGTANDSPCAPSNGVANPSIQAVPALPTGTSAPNTMFTEYAVHKFHLQVSAHGWLVQTTGPLTATQITNARQAASAAGLSIESKNDEPSSSEIIDWATVFGILLALGILGMTVGLLRSETASDLRVLGATGASAWNRRSITAATGAALGLLGAVLGIVAGYVACIAFLRGNANDGLSSLHNIPIRNLLLLLLGMPVIAAVVGFVLSGREQIGMGQQPTE